MKRRQFIQTGVLAAAGLMLPDFLRAAKLENHRLLTQGNKILVVLELNGGNDGLNTVIPVRNDHYYRLRPGIGIPKDKALILNDEAGLHPALKGLKSLYDEGHLSILNSVGYPNPDRSHFRSMDIWQSASESDEIIQSGWIGRYLDIQCRDCDRPVQALEIDDMLSLALKGNSLNGIAVKDPAKLYRTSHSTFFKDLSELRSESGRNELPVDYLYKTLDTTLSSADYIFKESKAGRTSGNYPKSALGSNFKTVASLILSGINTRIYYLSLTGFDTHVNQQGQQNRLFEELNDAVSAFTDDMKANGRFQDVMLMTFSEFGRRVAENASGGTDHGTANCMFLIGGGLKQPGVYNPLPDLNTLTEGDLNYDIDFKDVYATVLNRWLNVDDRIILGKQYGYLPFC